MSSSSAVCVLTISSEANLKIRLLASEIPRDLSNKGLCSMFLGVHAEEECKLHLKNLGIDLRGDNIGKLNAFHVLQTQVSR